MSTGIERKPTVLISQAQVREAVRKLAAQIRQDYKGEQLVLVGILKGSFVFMADLVRELKIPVQVDFVKLSSYGCGTESSGEIKLRQRLGTRIRGANVVIVEDIIDTGLTVNFLLDYLKKKGPRSVKVCALLDKPARRKIEVPVDYLGYTVPNKFVVGYGLDFDEKFRNLPFIGVMRGR